MHQMAYTWTMEAENQKAISSHKKPLEKSEPDKKIRSRGLRQLLVYVTQRKEKLERWKVKNAEARRTINGNLENKYTIPKRWDILYPKRNFKIGVVKSSLFIHVKSS